MKKYKILFLVLLSIFILSCKIFNQNRKEKQKDFPYRMEYESRNDTLIRLEYFPDYTLITEFYDSSTIKSIFRRQKCPVIKVEIDSGIDSQTIKRVNEIYFKDKDSPFCSPGTYIEFWRNGVIKSIRTNKRESKIRVVNGYFGPGSSIDISNNIPIGDQIDFDSTGKIIMKQ